MLIKVFAFPLMILGVIFLAYFPLLLHTYFSAYGF